MAIFDAIQAMDWAAAQDALAKADSPISARGPQGESLIQEAVYRGGAAFANALADQLREQLDVFECTVLNRVESLESLLTTTPTAAKDKSYDGWTALHLAGFVGAQGCAAMLLARGADVDERSANPMANSPLSATLAGSGSLEIVALLLKAGADPNGAGAGGITPLHLAASRGSLDAIAALRAAGATATAAENGQTPADIATERGFPEAAQALS